MDSHTSQDRHQIPTSRFCPIRVSVPATTANLGPGFDSMGMALDLWNTFTLSFDGPSEGLTVEIIGEGTDDLPRGDDHLTVQTMRDALLAEAVPPPPGMRLVCENDIPCASGLGSSSSAVIAGLVLAEAISLQTAANRPARPYEIDLAQVLSRAVEIEGHGDNVTPAVLGGLQVVYTHGAEYRNRAIPIPPTRVVVCVPEYRYLTTQARAALPPVVSHKDAVFNIGHAMLVIEALRNQDDTLLADAMQDRLHEQYRIPDIPGAEEARAAALSQGAIAVGLSGAGPGLIAFARNGHDAIGEAMVAAFGTHSLCARYWVLSASGGGTRIEIG
jgi:homoserine kinase